MIAQHTCFDCLQRQVQHFSSSLKDQNLDVCLATQKILAPLRIAPPVDSAPPQIAIDVYENLSTMLGVSDPFLRIKQESMRKAKHALKAILGIFPPSLPNILDFLESDLSSLSVSDLPLSDSHKEKLLAWAIKVAVIGNVIDYGSQSTFSFEEADFDPLGLEFAFFDINGFINKIQNARIMLYLADNAGENYFDEVLLATLKILYPTLAIYYAVRGKPIINDLTMADMSGDARSIERFCTLLDSGVRSPGFVYRDANAQTQKIFDTSSVILAKGMGNFECLESHKDERLFLLFKIKCDVVANFLGIPRNKMVFKHNI
uniref:Damage-control phosphatase ARMT1-like metal-binding domain-containing protein n=1 Tax=uncultured Helicobacter sp. TaxID=175537 RepID=A0A650ELH8_9HELI|nr:hypothetical protein Helico4rc_2510 [uncultured Helicobacter sp.]